MEDISRSELVIVGGVTLRDMALSMLLQPNRGFHFECSTTLLLEDTKPECAVYILYIFPPNLFVDKYELKQYIDSFTLHGHADLELPIAAVEKSPPVLEVRVHPPPLGKIIVKFPLHARYPYTGASPYSTVRVPEPRAFWACPLPEGSPAQNDVFSDIPSPYVPSFSLDAWSVTFFDAKPHERYHEIQIPAGTSAHVQIVEFGTIFIVLTAFFYVARAVWKKSLRLQQGVHKKHE